MYPSYPDVEYYKKRGRAVHYACELSDTGKLGRIDERLTGWVDGWRSFVHAAKPKIHRVEHRVASVQYRYCGTLDRHAELDGAGAVIDIKCGDPPACTALQTALYRKGLLETDGVYTERRIAVRLYETGAFRVTEYHNHPEDERTALCAVSVWWWRNKHGL